MTDCLLIVHQYTTAAAAALDVSETTSFLKDAPVELKKHSKSLQSLSLPTLF
jgi:hypothetical protein